MRWTPPNFGSLAASITVPSGAAGIIFILSWAALAFAGVFNTRPSLLGSEAIPAFFAMAIPATFCRFFIALLPMVLGVSIMGVLGGWSAASRVWFLWPVAGCVLMAAINLTLGIAFDQMGLTLLLTAALCALLARRYVRWPEREDFGVFD